MANVLNVEGEIITGKDPGYAMARKIWNSDVKSEPSVIFRPKNVEDLKRIVSFASHNKKSLTIKNGGHGASGASLNPNGFVVDMHYFKQYSVDLQGSNVTLSAGLLNNEVAKILDPLQKFVPIGTCPDVGISGLTLGGGIGFLSKKYGLTCDNVNYFKVLTGEGKEIIVNGYCHPELFSVLKGAGHCNFGIVTEINYQLVDIPSVVFGGTLAFSIKSAKKVLAHYLELMQSNEDNDLFIYCSINNDILEELSIQIYGIYLGDSEKGKNIFRNIKLWGNCFYDDTEVCPYSKMQGSYEEHVPDYPFLKWKSGFLKPQISPDFSDAVIDAYMKRPNKLCRSHFDPLGGKIAEVPQDETAFINRKSPFLFSILAIWYDQNERDLCREWAQNTHKTLAPFFQSFGHANYDDDSLECRKKAYFGERGKALMELKKIYDPLNIFKGVLHEQF